MRPPQEKGHWLFGSIKDFQKRPYSFPFDVSKKHGGIARFRILHRRFIAVSDPQYYDHIFIKNHAAYERSVQFRNQFPLFGRGMVSTEGEEWQKKRTRGMPAFNREALKKMVPLSVRITQKSLDKWDKTKEISLIPETQILTISIMCQSIFSVDIDEKTALEFGDIIRESMMLIRKKNTAVFPIPLWLPHKSNRAFKATRIIFDKFVEDKLLQRDPNAKDILGIILNGRSPKDLSPIERREIVDECKTLLVAGFESTSFTLTWTLYLLARHPEIQKRWQDECRQVLNGRDPEWDDLDKLTFTKQVILESMRLHPVIFTQPRECIADDKIGPYQIKKGDLLLMSIFGIHRSPDIWDRPEEYNPDRFAENGGWSRQNFMPFGKGKHTCIGNNFAIYELLSILSMIGRRYHLHREEQKPVGLNATIVLMPDQDIHLKLRPL